MLLSGEHDDLNAIVELHSWSRWEQRVETGQKCYLRMQSTLMMLLIEGSSLEVLDYLDGDVAGIKSVTMLIKGDNVYGHLKAEAGKLSSFSALITF